MYYRKNQIKGKSVRELVEMATNYSKYWESWGGSNEEDHCINDISLELIVQFKAEHPDEKIYLIKINKPYNATEVDEKVIVEFIGQKIYTFEYDYVSTICSDELRQRIIDYRNAEVGDLVNKYLDIIKVFGNKENIDKIERLDWV